MRISFCFIYSVIFSFFSISVYGAGLDGLDPNKVTVCSAAINSTKEFDVFKKTFSQGRHSGQFQFVELTSLGTPENIKSGRVDGWFDRACASGVQCNMLVVSAHFTSNGFFSDDKNPSPFRYPLSTDNLENHMCKMNCDGILSHPQETFLMSCNTLSGKQRDHRTPEMYLQILKKDGANRSRAELAVEGRYGTGLANKEKIEFAFGGGPTIYGFKSTSQLADNNVKYLENYFKQVPDYSQHLQQDAVDLISAGLRQLQNFPSHREMASAFSSTSLCISRGNYLGRPEQAEIWRKICALRDPALSDDEHFNVITQMMESSQRTKFTHEVENFLARYTAKGKKIPTDFLTKMKSLDEAKSFYMREIELKKDYPTLRLRLVRLAKRMGWLPSASADPLIAEITTELNSSDWPKENF